MERKTNENPCKTVQNRTSDDDTGLSPRQVQALAALLNSPSIVAAAARVGIHEGTIRRWIRDDSSFRLKLRELRTEALTGASNRLQDGCWDVFRGLGPRVYTRGSVSFGVHTRLDAKKNPG